MAWPNNFRPRHRLRIKTEFLVAGADFRRRGLRLRVCGVIDGLSGGGAGVAANDPSKHPANHRRLAHRRIPCHLSCGLTHLRAVRLRLAMTERRTTAE